MYIPREMEQVLKNRLQPGKVLMLLGPRRVGKTVLLQRLLQEHPEASRLWNGEDFAVQELLQRRSAEHYRQLLGNTRLLAIDEAQHIPRIGLILKLLVDSLPEVSVLVTGSSAFSIRNAAEEPLAGRKIVRYLWPLTERECSALETPEQHHDNLRQRLVFGNMPEVQFLAGPEQKIEYLRELVNATLMKEVLAFEHLKRSDKLFSLLKLIAFQVGSEVSLEELGRRVSLSKNTVERYLDLLSKVYVIHRLGGFSRNLRKEVTKHARWYFYDNGIRNTVIADFRPVTQRPDTGPLWENYALNERIKYQQLRGELVNRYFWRTYDRQEIDLVEERGGALAGYEFKWSSPRRRAPAAWITNYPEATFTVITPQDLATLDGSR